MGSYVSCISSGSAPSTTHDMSSVRNKNLPFVWITGPPNSGKKTIGRLIKNKYEFENINITDLLRQEASKDNRRSILIKRHINANRKVPDSIVIDVLKEAILNSTNNKGFIISNFPKTLKQAEMFTRDVANVTLVFYLYTGVPQLIDRAQRKSVVPLDNDVLRRNLTLATREIKACLGKFAVKIESINTNGLPEETFLKVETAMIRRINVTRPIITETDYIQVQQNQQSSRRSKTSSVESAPAKEENNKNEEAEEVQEHWEVVPLVMDIEKQVSAIENFEEEEIMKRRENNIKNFINSNEKDKEEKNCDEKENPQEEQVEVKREAESEEKEIKLTDLNQEAPIAKDNIV